MNKIFKLVLSILIIEIFIGYFFYLHDSSRTSGQYLSSIIQLIVKTKTKFLDDTNTVSDKDIKKQNNNCTLEKKINNNFEISGVNIFRQSLKFQSNIDFIEKFDHNEDFLIFLLGNSETYGNHYHKEEEKIHVLLQNNLRSFFNSEKIFVINLSWPARIISDHLPNLLAFKNIYDPDLVIFYTGGNELNFIEPTYNQLLKNSNLNFQNQYWYKYFNSSKTFEDCINDQIFLKKKNFQFNLKKYLNENFDKISTTLKKEKIEYIFYIHPINQETETSTKEIEDNRKILSNLSFDNDNFINLNNISSKLDIEFLDLFHTDNGHVQSKKITTDVIERYKDKIYAKISK